MYKIIITGPAASGKDVLRRKFEDKGYIYAKPYTTRPKRDGETDGDYTFVSDNEFAAMCSSHLFAASACYNGWMYGIATSDYIGSNVAVLTPEYIDILKRAGLMKDCFTILLMPNEEIRRKRLLQRKDADSVERRLEADRKQFECFNDYDIVITNPDF